MIGRPPGYAYRGSELLTELVLHRHPQGSAGYEHPDFASSEHVGDGVYHYHQFPPIYRVESFRYIDANHVDGALVLPGIGLKPAIGPGYISCAPPMVEPALSTKFSRFHSPVIATQVFLRLHSA